MIYAIGRVNVWGNMSVILLITIYQGTINAIA